MLPAYHLQNPSVWNIDWTNAHAVIQFPPPRSYIRHITSSLERCYSLSFLFLFQDFLSDFLPTSNSLPSHQQNACQSSLILRHSCHFHQQKSLPWVRRVGDNILRIHRSQQPHNDSSKTSDDNSASRNSTINSKRHGFTYGEPLIGDRSSLLPNGSLGDYRCQYDMCFRNQDKIGIEYDVGNDRSAVLASIDAVCTRSSLSLLS